jgi:hypothetical protein
MIILILILLSIIGGIIKCEILDKPKKIVLEAKKPSQMDRTKKILESEWNHFNFLRADQHKETETTIEMIGALEQELKCHLRRIK